jgi:hypothetical protein
MVSKRSLEKCLENLYKNNIKHGRSHVAGLIMDMGYSKATAYRKVLRIEAGSLKRIVGSGRPPTVAKSINVENIAKFFDQKSGVSQKEVAKTYNCNQSTISRILKQKTNVRVFKKKRRPFRTPTQKKAMRPKCRKMGKIYENLDFLMDDESYFTLTNSTLAGNDRFYAADPELCPDNIRFRLVKKYEDKLLVSICISPRGLSPIYIHSSKQAVNQTSYKNILENTLLPLISKYYKRNNGFVFWPDLATSHYSKSVLEFLRRKKIKVVPRDVNPANTPEARPIENFWGDLKRLVYANNWQAKDLNQLEERIRSCYKKMNNEIFLKQIKDLSKKLNKIAKYGL